jgi:hypothetical protein
MPASFNRNRLWIQKYFYFKHHSLEIYKNCYNIYLSKIERARWTDTDETAQTGLYSHAALLRHQIYTDVHQYQFGDVSFWLLAILS